MRRALVPFPRDHLRELLSLTLKFQILLLLFEAKSISALACNRFRLPKVAERAEEGLLAKGPGGMGSLAE